MHMQHTAARGIIQGDEAIPLPDYAEPYHYPLFRKLEFVHGVVITCRLFTKRNHRIFNIHQLKLANEHRV